MQRKRYYFLVFSIVEIIFIGVNYLLIFFFSGNNSILNDTNSLNCSIIANIVNSELPTVRKKERDYMGMFEFSKNDVPVILQVLITGKLTKMAWIFKLIVGKGWERGKSSIKRPLIFLLVTHFLIRQRKNDFLVTLRVSPDPDTLKSSQPIFCILSLGCSCELKEKIHVSLQRRFENKMVLIFAFTHFQPQAPLFSYIGD